jgi:CSLREA domain-containing protein
MHERSSPRYRSAPLSKLAARGDRLCRPLRLEPLEDRRLLANVTVGNLNDLVNGTVTSIAALVASNGGDGISLREAVLAANADVAADTIDFAPSVAGTIQLTNVGHVGEIVITNNVTIAGPGANALTIRAFAGTAAVRDGARIFNVDDGTFLTKIVDISGLTITGGDGNDDGGGIFNAEHLILADSTISGNAAGFGNGGGIGNDGILTATRCTIRDNASHLGGGVMNSYGRLELVDSTVSDNTASDRGGGIFTNTSFRGVARTILQGSTISGNSALFGGGVSTGYGVTLINNSTITANTAAIEGAGIGAHSQNFMEEQAATVVLGSIIAGNFGSDVHWSGDRDTFFSDGYNVIGGGNAVGNFIEPGDQTNVTNPLLGPLTYNGGPILTHALLAGSPAINAGDPADVGAPGQYDQRGAPYARVFGGRIDVGAFERQNLGAPQSFVVDTLSDELDGDNGPGDLSLREAVQLANVNINMADAITFHASLAGGTILLTQGELAVTDAAMIAGPGAPLLTIDATGNDPTPEMNNGDGSRVFNIDDGSPLTTAVVEISGLTLTGGDVPGAGGGGGISSKENLTVTRSMITGNAAVGSFNYGGGVQMNGGALTVAETTIAGNTARSGGGVANFGGSLVVTGSTISGNTATDRGGGVFGSGSAFTTITVRHSTITNNQAVQGGGVFVNFNGPATLDHAIVADNTASIAPNISSTLTATYSLIGDKSGTSLAEAPVGSPDANGNLIGGPVNGAIDPLVGPLAANGGPTVTHALLSGSPAIDAGDPAAMAGMGGVPLHDQRGAPSGRVAGGRIDIGAMEFQAAPASADFDLDTDVDGFDFLAWQRGFCIAAGATRAQGNANAGSDGDVDGDDLAVWKSQFGQAQAAVAALSAAGQASTVDAVFASFDVAGVIAGPETIRGKRRGWRR